MSAGQESGTKATPAASDVATCEREPIHAPGAIQPHGAVLAALVDDRIVTHASANLATILGRPAGSVLGRPLGEAVGEAACRVLQAAGPRDGTVPVQAYSLPAPDGGTLNLHAHRSGRHILIDIEPIRPKSGTGTPVTLAQSVLETFSLAATRADLCDLAVRGLRSITGYDRVMAYRFGEGGHGEVIAEACAPQLEPYLGLRYPATDIPSQARRLYLRHRVGAIADSSYQPVPLLVDPTRDDGTPLDLTHSAMRSVSPYHLEYMRNMKTAASLTIGLAQGQDLWGMLVCHHGTPRIAGPELRAVAEMIGQVVSLLIASLGESEEYVQRFERIATLRALIDRLAAAVPLPDALTAAKDDLLGLVEAEGALVRLSGKVVRLGRTPPLSDAQQALALLLSEAGGDVLALDDLGLRYPELGSCRKLGSGVLLLPLAPDTDDAILWFRPELSRTVTWGGNPAAHAVDPVTASIAPRVSFAAWKEIVKGHSAPWVKADLALARDLRGVMAAELARRTKADLARLRHYDPLTGLPNRRLLEDWLAEAQREAGTDTAVLFLDIDRFKAVNDMMGHAAGDALLVEVARRLRAAACPGSKPARLGGDEFIVLCRGLDRDAVAELGERIRQAMEAPVQIAGRLCHVSTSIGIAVAGQSGGLDLIQAADMAMYVAKRHGGNRAKVFELSLYDHAAHEFELDRDLREALSTGDRFRLLYQPMFGIAGGPRKLAGFEALLRWRRPRLGWLAPESFIPQAEASGLILPLGEWILSKALREGRRLASQDSGLSLAVNFSALQLAQPGFCSGLAELLQAEGFPPDRLCVEVTESMLTDAAISCALADVRTLGVKVAIDDFGMGYSSLSCLRRLPVDVVKLDRNFVKDVDGDPRGADFVGAVIAVAHAAGMSVVVEGIETQAQFDIAATAGADVVQGFLFAPPLSATAAAELAAPPAAA
jgi:diguanylate cyclase (GGDEF)-like protein